MSSGRRIRWGILGAANIASGQFTRLLGDDGGVHLTNPFHPTADDRLEIHRSRAEPVVEHPTRDAHSFTAALRPIHAVVRGEEEPRHLAVDSALSTATTLASLQELVAA